MPTRRLVLSVACAASRLIAPVAVTPPVSAPNEAGEELLQDRECFVHVLHPTFEVGHGETVGLEAKHRAPVRQHIDTRDLLREAGRVIERGARYMGAELDSLRPRCCEGEPGPGLSDWKRRMVGDVQTKERAVVDFGQMLGRPFLCRDDDADVHAGLEVGGGFDWMIQLCRAYVAIRLALRRTRFLP